MKRGQRSMSIQYPIGEFSVCEEDINENKINTWIMEIEKFPRLLRKVVEELTEDELNIPYRTEGWTVRQLIHHLADSHLNAYLRVKLALTEENPMIKDYQQDQWARLEDYHLPIEVSLSMIETVHLRWTVVLKSLSIHDWERTFVHPESGQLSIGKAIGMYAWHGRHHLAHITSKHKGEK